MITFKLPKKVTGYLYYRNRYWFAYIFAVTVVLTILATAWLYVPGGLRAAEVQSVITSGGLSLPSIAPGDIVNLPYHIIQQLSISIFGMNTLSITLPSFIIASLIAVGILLLLKTWFRQSAAIPSALIAVTLPQFIFTAQDGTPTLSLFIGLSLIVLLAASYVSLRRTPRFLWKLISFISIGLLMYVPLGFYLVLAILITTIVHPHARTVFKRLPRMQLMVGLIIFGIIISPIAYAIFVDYTVGLTLLGIPTTAIDVAANVNSIANQLFGFFSLNNSTIISPIYPLPVALLIIFGVWRIITVRYMAKSYAISFWLLFLAPCILLNPDALPALYIIAIILMAFGINLLLNKWYGLFPKNPYARVAGVILIAVMVLSIVFSNLNQYIYTYHYTPKVVENFSRDIDVLNDHMYSTDYSSTTPTLLVASEEESLYLIGEKYGGLYKVSTNPSTEASVIIVTNEAKKQIDFQGEPDRILTSKHSNNADRFYIYKFNR